MLRQGQKVYIWLCANIATIATMANTIATISNIATIANTIATLSNTTNIATR